MGRIKLKYTDARVQHCIVLPYTGAGRQIWLCTYKDPQFHALTSLPWLLYSFSRTYLPGHGRAYYCIGENEIGEPFIARIAYRLWHAFEEGGEQAFLAALKPETIAELEKKLRRRATRAGNLWALSLPTSWQRLRDWALTNLGWDLVPRSHTNFHLLGRRSYWDFSAGMYARPWHTGEKIAVAGGGMDSLMFNTCVYLKGPHLIGTIPGWEYC